MPFDFKAFGNAAKTPTTTPQQTKPAAKFDFSTFGSDAPAAPAQNKDGMLKTFGKALISSELNFGKSIADALPSFVPGSAAWTNKQNEEIMAQNQVITDNLLKTIKEKKAKGEDTTHLEAVLQQHLKDTSKPAIDINETNASVNKSAKQIFGEGLGVATDILAAGAYGKAAKGAQSGKLLISGPVSNTVASALGKAGIGSTVYQKAATPVVKELAKETLGQTLKGIAKKTAVRAAEGAGVGYAYDVANKAQANEDTKDVFTPGVGTAFGAAIPVAIGAGEAGMAIAKDQAPRLINSLIKPLAKDFSYGKNPGRTVSEMGITGNSMDDLANNISTARKDVGQKLSETTASLDGKVKLDVSDALKPIDDAMEQAAKSNNQPLLKRLADAKMSLTENLARDTQLPNEAIKSFSENAIAQLRANGSNDVADLLSKVDLSGADTASALRKQVIDTLGPDAFKSDDVSNWYKTIVNYTKDMHPELAQGNVVSLGTKKLDGINVSDAINFKREIGDITQWTGNPSDDKAVNAALKRAYGLVKEKVNKAAESVSPETAAAIRDLNEKYADLTSAEIATKYRDIINQRKNLVSLPIKVGSVTALITALSTGGAAIPAILAGTGAAALDKALESAAVKTRVAAWLGSETPSAISAVLTKNPAIKDVLYRAFPKMISTLGND